MNNNIKKRMERLNWTMSDDYNKVSQIEKELKEEGHDVELRKLKDKEFDYAVFFRYKQEGN